MNKIIRIKGVREDAALIKNNLEIMPCNSIFILDKGICLYKFIEDLEVDDNLLYNLKITNEIDFTGLSVELRDKITDDLIFDNITSLSILFERIDDDKVKSCRLILDTEDNDLISEIMQALIYLNIELEVMKIKEKRDREIISSFRRKFDKIRASVINGEKAIHNIVTPDYLLNEKDKFLNTLYDIENDLEKARERDLNISVMATKKAGKSVIVNSFLNEQYAPTSFELPTPNNCIYKSSKDNNIRLLYGKNDILFKSPQDIYKYIYKEFKSAQYDKANGCTIDDMEIYYSNPVNSFASFTVIDTPGCNYAAATNTSNGENMHKKLAYKWVEKSDVALFVINYSSYLTIDEEQFFKDIKSQFEKHDKFYSLIVVVNKLDEMYISECENKSVVRFLDYIRCKLNDLGYKGFVVMGTSARSYFDLIKVCKIDSDVCKSIGEIVPIENLKGFMLRARLKTLKKKFIGKVEMSSLSFVDDQLEKLECFYGLRDYDLNTLREKSGILNLKNYTRFIAIQKANIELYGLLIRSIDEKYVNISNSFIINSLSASKKEKTEQIQEIENMLHSIIERFDLIQQDMENKLSFKVFQDKLLMDIRVSIDEIVKHMLDLCETRVDEFFMKLMLKNSDELRKLKNETRDINFTNNNKVFNEEFKMIIENSMKILNCELDRKEKYIKEAETNMKETVQTFSEIIRKEYDLKDFNIKVPQIDQDFKIRMLVNMPVININNNSFKEKILDSIQVQGNVFGKLLNYLIKNKFGIYLLNSRQLQKIKNDYIEYIRNREYNAYYNLLRDNLLSCIDKYKRQIDQEFKSIISIYRNIFTDILNDLSTTKLDSENQLKLLESKLQFYSEVDKGTKDFINEWEIMRKESV